MENDYWLHDESHGGYIVAVKVVYNHTVHWRVMVCDLKYKQSVVYSDLNLLVLVRENCWSHWSTHMHMQYEYLKEKELKKLFNAN